MAYSLWAFQQITQNYKARRAFGDHPVQPFRFTDEETEAQESYQACLWSTQTANDGTGLGSRFLTSLSCGLSCCKATHWPSIIQVNWCVETNNSFKDSCHCHCPLLLSKRRLSLNSSRNSYFIIGFYCKNGEIISWKSLHIRAFSPFSHFEKLSSTSSRLPLFHRWWKNIFPVPCNYLAPYFQ